MRNVAGVQHEWGVGLDAGEEGPEPALLVLEIGAEPQTLDGWNWPVESCDNTNK